jgi:hypothetical protein
LWCRWRRPAPGPVIGRATSRESPS